MKKKKYDNLFSAGTDLTEWALPLMVNVDIVPNPLKGQHNKLAMLWIVSITLFCFYVAWSRFEVLSHEPKKKR